MKNTKKSIILGFALFATFFGAGNVLLPPTIGLNIGKSLLSSTIAFALPSVGLSLVSLLIVFRNKGEYKDLFAPMGESFYKIFLLLSFLSIGPIIAIPRTASTTFELGILPIIPNANRMFISLIFFVIVVLFCLNKTNVLDEIGKILTPLLLLTLICLIVVAIFSPELRIARPAKVPNTFIYSFLEGYNTLDAIGAMMFGKLIYQNVRKEKDAMKISVSAAIIAAVGLTLVYYGLMFLGNSVNIQNAFDLSRTQLLVALSNQLLGNYGRIILAIIVTLACLTTAIGLTVAVSDYFESLFKSSVEYKNIVIVIAAISFILSQLSVDLIIKLAVPILFVFYPVMIIILIFNVFKGKLITDKVISNCTYTAVVITIFDMFVKILPLSSIGMAWIFPTIIVFIFTIILEKRK